ncbi:hypothetical protein PIB30_039024 [Stylosanthes scabra]|uniref:Uncharacterized protein n=1 Tax=Stylosanthes scabra TaxID=79078 RepID=A0ABU6RE80_9FABA|nr:hypothetical protein [Stylosanthes scabra]
MLIPDNGAKNLMPEILSESQNSTGKYTGSYQDWAWPSKSGIRSWALMQEWRSHVGSMLWHDPGVTWGLDHALTTLRHGVSAVLE